MTQSILDTDSDKKYEELTKHLKRPSYTVKTVVPTAYIQKNFGKLSFDEISDHLNISNKNLKKMVRTVFPLDSRPFLFQRLLKQTLDNLSFKWLDEDSLSLVKDRAIELGKIYSANQKFKRLHLENYPVMCIVVIAEAYSQITKKDTLYFVRSKLKKNVTIAYSGLSLILLALEQVFIISEINIEIQGVAQAQAQNLIILGIALIGIFSYLVNISFEDKIKTVSRNYD